MGTTVRLLGTGNPYPSLERRGPAVVVEADEQRVLVDAGEGVLGQLLAVGVAPESVDTVLLTHFHSDHTVGLPAFVFGSWTLGRKALRLIAPPGMNQVWDLYAEMFASDIDYRVGLGWPREAMNPHVDEVHDGWTQEFGSVTVTARRVNHVGPDCFGYRFDTTEARIVVSGDTAYCPQVVELAQDADILINNCSISRPATPVTEERVAWGSLRENLSDHVCTPESAGRIARDANVDALVLTHVQPATEPDYVIERAKQSGFQGSITVGQDLMAFRPGRTPELEGDPVGH